MEIYKLQEALIWLKSKIETREKLYVQNRMFKIEYKDIRTMSSDLVPH